MLVTLPTTEFAPTCAECDNVTSIIKFNLHFVYLMPCKFPANGV
uniref:Uncharacterized protein n=1 Tax=Arundo donax TaxID=35708 RepID=A0A0A9DTF3_ARUDO